MKNTIRGVLANTVIKYFPNVRGKGRLWRLLAPEEGWFHCKFGIPMRLSPRDYTSRRLIEGDAGSELPIRFASETPRGGCFIDIGANRGPYSCLAGVSAGESGLVVAVEPNRNLWGALTDNLNRHVRGQLVLAPFALATESGWVGFDVDDRSHTGAGHMVLQSGASAGQKFVPATTLGAAIEPFLPSERIPIRIKIDVEGAEFLVLQTLREVLCREGCEAVLVEICPTNLARFGADVDDVYGLMDELGFSPRVGRDQASAVIARDGLCDEWFVRD